jgi:hypothetical protein
LTTFAIHQPNYVPWPGYFHKLAVVDVFVYLDAVQYPRGQSFAARNRIKTPNGVTYLTVPVSVPKGSEGKASYLEVDFADDKWRRKHAATVEQSYARAPHFDEIFERYAQHVESAESLVGLNVELIDAFAEYLGIDTRRVRLSELLPSFGQKTDLIVDVARALDASAYLSGSGGGREYTEEAVLGEHGIELRFDEFEYPHYEQLWGDFEPNLSVLDVLFNCGRGSRELILG